MTELLIAMKRAVLIAAMCGAAAVIADNCDVVNPGATNKCGRIVAAHDGAKGLTGGAEVFWPEGNCMFAHYTLRFLYFTPSSVTMPCRMLI